MSLEPPCASRVTHHDFEVYVPGIPGLKRLYEATLSAARYNPSIRAIYRRLKDQGRPDKVARTAAARKLLLIAHAIYKKGRPFQSPGEEEA